MTQEQINWAKTQPWFNNDNGDGTIVVNGRYRCGGTFGSFSALKDWVDKEFAGKVA